MKRRLNLIFFILITVFLSIVLFIFFPRKLIASNEKIEWEQIVIFQNGEMIYLEDVIDKKTKTELEQVFRKYNCYLSLQSYENYINDIEDKEEYFFAWQTFQFDMSRAQWMLDIGDGKACRYYGGRYTYKIYNEEKFITEVKKVLSAYSANFSI